MTRVNNPRIRLGETNNRPSGNRQQEIRERIELIQVRNNNRSIPFNSIALINNSDIGRLNREERRERGDRTPRFSRNLSNISARFNREEVIQIPSLNSLDGFAISSCRTRGRNGETLFPVSQAEFNIDTPRYIHPHNYIPPRFIMHELQGEESENLFMGCEIEVDKGGYNEENAKFVQDFLGEDNCYIVHDGSLNDGFEIVTHPCSIKYHKSLPYKDLFEKLVKKGYKSHETSTCGLHIHINRSFFGNEVNMANINMGKMIYLVQSLYHYGIKTIARRGETRYNQEFLMDNYKRDGIFTLSKQALSSKYFNVNLQHKNTVELRLFKGTLKYETFIATLEFARNLAYISKETDFNKLDRITIDDIINYKPTEFLVDYFEARNKKEDMNTFEFNDESPYQWIV